MSTLSTHVLDSVTGTPAAGMQVRLERWDGTGWAGLDGGRTDDDGRLRDLGPDPLVPGDHRLTFATQAWSSFFPEVTITFRVDEDRHYHVPLLLAPYAYSTYRGS